MNKKKIITSFLAVSTILTLAACNSEEDKKEVTTKKEKNENEFIIDTTQSDTSNVDTSNIKHNYSKKEYVANQKYTNGKEQSRIYNILYLNLTNITAYKDAKSDFLYANEDEYFRQFYEVPSNMNSYNYYVTLYDIEYLENIDKSKLNENEKQLVDLLITYKKLNKDYLLLLKEYYDSEYNLNVPDYKKETFLEKEAEITNLFLENEGFITKTVQDYNELLINNNKNDSNNGSLNISGDLIQYLGLKSLEGYGKYSLLDEDDTEGIINLLEENPRFAIIDNNTFFFSALLNREISCVSVALDDYKYYSQLEKESEYYESVEGLKEYIAMFDDFYLNMEIHENFTDKEFENLIYKFFEIDYNFKDTFLNQNGKTANIYSETINNFYKEI